MVVTEAGRAKFAEAGIDDPAAHYQGKTIRVRGVVARREEPSGRDPYAMYEDLCRLTGRRHDPCLLDTLLAAVRYMEGEPERPRWEYTAERKKTLEARIPLQLRD